MVSQYAYYTIYCARCICSVDDSDFDEVDSAIVTINKDKEKYGQLLMEKGKSSLYVHKKVDGYSLKKKYLALNYSKELLDKYEFMMKGSL